MFSKKKFFLEFKLWIRRKQFWKLCCNFSAKISTQSLPSPKNDLKYLFSPIFIPLKGSSGHVEGRFNIQDRLSRQKSEMSLQKNRKRWIFFLKNNVLPICSSGHVERCFHDLLVFFLPKDGVSLARTQEMMEKNIFHPKESWSRRRQFRQPSHKFFCQKSEKLLLTVVEEKRNW